MLSIVIPYRNEDMLEFTIRRVRETARIPCEIIAIDDGSDQSADLPDDVRHFRSPTPVRSPARHIGIERATHDCVLVIDAHMNFWEDDWAERLVEYIRCNPTHVGCTICLGLGDDRMEMEEAVGRYHGAHVLLKETADDAFNGPPALKHRILVDKWNSQSGVGEVGCIMGGAYFMSKNWYLDALKAPWEELRGWGPCEGILSIANYFMGGENVCLDIEIGHMFRSSAPYPSNIYELIYNELFLAHVVIQDDGKRDELIQFLDLPDDGDTKMAWELLNRSIHRSYRQYLIERGKRTWADYKSRWMAPNVQY